MVIESEEDEGANQHNSGKSDEENAGKVPGKGSPEFSPNECKKENDSDLEDFFN